MPGNLAYAEEACHAFTLPGKGSLLEGDLWTTVHAQLGAEIARQLVPKLRPRYLALTVERFVLDVPDDVSVETQDI